jgi:branched-chain amino acid transport system ATP-binding protein
MMTLLKIDNLTVGHGLLQAVRGVSFTVDDGEILALVGANRAGSGNVTFDGHDVTALPAYRRVQRGIALVPEGRKLFGELTVEENLRVAGRRGRPGPWNPETTLAAFPILGPLRKRQAASLSGGQQQAASIARALMTNPRLLLVDEISLGLAPVAVDGVYESVRVLKETGTSLILVEQDLSRALSVAGHVLCMLEGRVVLSAATADVTREQVTASYFGMDRRPFSETQ